MFKCFTCGAELTWSSSAALSDIDVSIPEDEPSCVHFYTCQNCGCSIEHYECPESDKYQYPFWKEEK